MDTLITNCRKRSCLLLQQGASVPFRRVFLCCESGDRRFRFFNDLGWRQGPETRGRLRGDAFHVQVPCAEQGGGAVPHFHLQQVVVLEVLGVVAGVGVPQAVRHP